MELRKEFDRCAKWLEDALAYSNGTHDIEDIWAGIESGQFQLWPGKNSAVITEIYLYPKKKVFHIFLAGGEMEELLEMWDSIEIYAKVVGCTSLSVSGRKGWMRVLESRGAKHLCTTVIKEL